MQVNRTDEVGRDEIVKAVADLQMIARALSQPYSTHLPALTVQVLYLSGTASAWRLIEITRSARRRQRRMLCFESLKAIRRAIEERIAWIGADEEFVAAYMATPAGFSGITSDWVHCKDFDLVFGPLRESIRAETCVTQAKYAVNLD
jgi:hypothetical protein